MLNVTLSVRVLLIVGVGQYLLVYSFASCIAFSSRLFWQEVKIDVVKSPKRTMTYFVFISIEIVCFR